MGSQQPIATFSRDGKPAAFRSVLLVLFFGPLGFFFGDSLGSMLGIGANPGRAIAIVVPTVLFVIFGYVMGGRGTVEFYDDAVRKQERRIPYEDVALAVREDVSFGTATFELVVLGGTNLTLRYVKNPDEVERLLARNLTAPADQLAAAPEDPETAEGDRQRIEDRWTFWEFWRSDEPLPESAVVDHDYLRDVMDVGSVDPNRIDRVDVRDKRALSDISKNDVTASNTGGPP